MIEVLSCKTPIISTDYLRGQREILAHGQFGQVVPVGGMTTLARAMETALAGDTPSPLSENWRPFEPNEVVAQHLNILMGS